ncbi:response regulator [Archangium lansingense]|uniref:Response regulator n=1 Tax=Archangium lansingense TaxID=2995310 RepID=A0ABT3ZX00_9BACT|nr:response regulator [Archangium lansinium]MCY1073641.1 response regulator [Archangium lansinium]
MSRLLIVDDEEILTDSLQDILEGEGHRVLTAHNGMAALDTLAREQLDLVLLDLMLPLVDGLTVLETLRRDTPSTAVLVVTSCASEALQGQLVQGFLRKPFSLTALLRAVEAVLPPVPPTPE